jgi:anaerobic magnesium-protoporphyrin IX monomethyl ester cyclase
MGLKPIERVLLVNPPYTFATYLNIDRNAGTMQHPVISLASIAGAIKDSCDVRIADLDLEPKNHREKLAGLIHEFKPDLVGITATTPVFPSLLEIASTIKAIDPEILVVAGGVHPTKRPEDALAFEAIDIVVVGEADFFLRDFVQSAERTSLKGAYFKQDGRIIFNGRRDLIDDLDRLPYPAWELYDLKKYRASRLIERYSPGGLLETSRGCPFSCEFCNKKIFGPSWRKKSVDRVVAEFRSMKKSGFKEIHIEDDGFTTDLPRAKTICRRLIEARISLPWTLINGIRVDRTDEELFDLLKAAGCYQVAFGIESGDDRVLKHIHKGITVSQIEKAVEMAAKAKLETFGFFLFGLSGETEESMNRTIDLARRLPLTIAKFGITTPYPGTPLYEQLDAQGRILNKNWKDYLIHNDHKRIFIHADVSWEMIQKYYLKAYREFYFRPKQFYRQFFSSLRDGILIDKISYLFKTKWI